MSSFSPSIFPSLLFSFNMEEIASETYNYHEALSQLKQEPNTQPFKLPELFTAEGINLCELFGFNLSKRLQKYSLKQRSNQSRIVWYEYKDFQKLILNAWTNMGQYQSLLPALFQLFKQSLGGYINMKHVDEFAKICREEIKSEVVALIKEKVSPQSLQSFQRRVFQAAEKEDLKGTGFIETKTVITIFGQLVGKSISKQIDITKLPKQLFQGDLINYQALFSDECLLSGQRLKQFMQGFCTRRIVKLIRLSNKRKREEKLFKSEYRKKVIKKQPQIMGQKLHATSKKQQLQQQAKEQIINEMLQKDKNQTQQLMRNKLSIAKEMLMEIIFYSVELAENVFMREEKRMEYEKHEEVKKTVYTMEPVVGEMIVDGGWAEGVRIGVLGAGVGVFLANGQGYTFELTNNTKLIPSKTHQYQSYNSSLTPINISISSLIKPSPIVDYQILHQKLYILREDGLFYVWNYSNSQSLPQTKHKDCYEKMIQTGYKFVENYHLREYHKALRNRRHRGNNVINLDRHTNIFVINCSSDPITPSFQLYDPELNYIGRVPISKSSLNPFTYQHFLQAQYFLTHIYPMVRSDLLIKQKNDYISLLRRFNFMYNKKFQDRLLGLFVLKEFNYHNLLESLQTRHLSIYFSFVVSQIHLNSIPLNESWYIELMEFKRLQRKFVNLSKKLIEYLHQLNYMVSIDSESQLREMLMNCQIQMIRDRKLHMMTLVQDNFNVFEQFFVEVESVDAPMLLISHEKLRMLLKNCDLSNQQILYVIQSLPTTVDNLIDLTSVFMVEHTLRVRDWKENKRSSERKYKLNSMPVVELEIVGVVLKYDLIVVRQSEGPLSHQKLYLLNTKGQIANYINIFTLSPSSSPLLTQYSQLFTTMVTQTNHLMCIKFKYVYIYNLSNNNLSKQSPSMQPVKTITNMALPGVTHPRVVSFEYLYEQEAIVLATNENVYVFDFTELISSNNVQHRFRLKPGYIGIVDERISNINNSHLTSHQHEIKRKYITPSNEFNNQLIISPTIMNQVILTIVSYNYLNRDLHVKSIYLAKHQLRVTKEHFTKPLPTKLFKQLQSRAKRICHQDRIRQHITLTVTELFLASDISAYFKKKLSLQTTPQHSHSSSININPNSLNSNNKISTIYQLNNIYGLLNNTKGVINQCNSIFRKQQSRINIPERYLRLFVVMIVVMSADEKELQAKLSKEFIAMYRKSQQLSSRTSRKQLLNDFATIQQKRFIDRLLYYCSLIDKFIITYMVSKNNNYDQQQLYRVLKGLVCDQDGELCVERVIGLVCHDQDVVVGEQVEVKKILMPSGNLVQSTFSTLLQLGRLNLIHPVQSIIIIIKHLIPTKYKYLSTRYYKQLIVVPPTHSIPSQDSSDQIISQFMSNNFDTSFSTQLSQTVGLKRFIIRNVNSCQASRIVPCKGLTQLLSDRNLLQKYTDVIQAKYPQVKKNYRQLVQKLYSYKMLTLFEMIYMITIDKVQFVVPINISQGNILNSFTSLTQTIINQQQIQLNASVQRLDFNKFSSQTIQLPISKVIEELWKSGNFLDRRELLNVIRWSLKELRLKEVNEWIDGGGVSWVKVSRGDNSQQTTKHQQLPLLIDPLQLPVITRHLQQNMSLTLQSIAYRLYISHQTLQLSKALISKTVQVNSYITYKQLVKFIGCESITRWLFRIKHYGQAVYLEDAVVICNTLRDVLCEKLWRYNMLLWGEEGVMCLLGLLKALADSTAMKPSRSQQPQSGRRRQTARLTQLAKYFIPCSSSQQQSLLQLRQPSHWVTILRYICQKYYKNLQKSQFNPKIQNKKSISNSEQSLQLLLSTGEITFAEFYNCLWFNLTQFNLAKSKGRVTLLQSLKQLYQSIPKQFMSEHIRLQQIIEFSMPQQLELVQKRGEVLGVVSGSNEGKSKSGKFIKVNDIGCEAILKVYCQSGDNSMDILAQLLPSAIPVGTWLSLRSYIKSQLVHSPNPFLLSESKKILLTTVYREILQQQSHQSNTLSQFYFNMMKYQKSTELNSISNDDRGNTTNINVMFGQFYSKLRSFSPKVFGRMSCYQIAVIYLLLRGQQQDTRSQRALSKQSKDEITNSKVNTQSYLISFTKLFHYSSILITPKIKQSWISTYILIKISIRKLLQDQRKQHKQQQSNNTIPIEQSSELHQLLVKLNVYGEMIVGNLWHQPLLYENKKVGNLLQQTDSRKGDNKIDNVISMLTEQIFDMRQYIFTKYFADYNINDHKSPLTQIIHTLTTLSLNSNHKQFLKLLHKHNQQFTNIEVDILYDYFKLHNQVNNITNLEGNNDKNIEDQAALSEQYSVKYPKQVLFSDCIKFINDFLSSDTSQQSQNINLHNQLNPSQFPVLQSYLKTNLFSQPQQQKRYYRTVQTVILHVVNNIISTSINQQAKVRDIVMKAICQMMWEMRVTLERLCAIVLNLKGQDEEMEQGDDTIMREFIRTVVLGRLDEMQLLPIFRHIDWNNTQLRQTLISHMVQSIITYDYNRHSRDHLTFSQLKKQLFYHCSNNNITPTISSSSPQLLCSSENQFIYEQVYKEMDLLGVGEVSLNDIVMIADNNSLMRSLMLSKQVNNNNCHNQHPLQSYVNITTYLRLHHPYIPHKLTYMNPNTNLLLYSSTLIQQLLSLQQQTLSFRSQEISFIGYSANRNKLITKQNVYKIMYPYVDQNEMGFVMEWFDANRQQDGLLLSDTQQLRPKTKQSQFINLSMLIKYLTGNISPQQQSFSSSTLESMKLLTEWIESEGGIRRAIRCQSNNIQKAVKILLETCPYRDIKYVYDNIGDLIIDYIANLIALIPSDNQLTSNLHTSRPIHNELKSTFSFYKQLRKLFISRNSIININQMIVSYLPLAVQEIVHYYYSSQLGLNTTSNRQLARLKSLTVKDFSLLKKMYIALGKGVSKDGKIVVNTQYEIFQKLITSIAQNDIHQSLANQTNTQPHKITFNLLDLWEFVNIHSLLPSSKKEINQIFRIIDQNDDKSISFKEFAAFWMALQQLLPKSLIVTSERNLSSNKTPMQQLKHTLRESFMSIFNHRIQSVTTSRNPITYTEIMSTFNTQNKQKINKLLQIVFQTDNQIDNDGLNIVELKGNKGYDSLIMINGVPEAVLDMARLRIMKRVCEVKEKNDNVDNKDVNIQAQYIRAKPSADLILQWTADDTYDFIYSKTKPFKGKQQQQPIKLKQQDLFKYLLLKYPTIGRSLVQSLFELNEKKFQWEKLLIILKGIMQKGVEWKSNNIGINNSTNTLTNEQYMRKIVSVLKAGDSIAKGYYSLTKPKIAHFYGQSLSFRFIIQNILSEIQLLQAETHQINHWVDHCCWNLQDKLPLIYSAKQNLGLMPIIGEAKSLGDCEMLMKDKYTNIIESLTKAKQSNEVFTQTFMQGKIRRQLKHFNEFPNKLSSMIEQTVILAKDTRFKSNNLANFSLNLPLYGDEQISSGGILAIDEMKAFKGQIMKIYTYQKTRSILQLSRPHQKNFKCINSLVQLAELNYKVHKKYRVAGLLIDLSNVCLIQNQDKFVFRNFYQGIVMGADGNFAEGFDLLDLYSHNQLNQPFTIISMPPQLQQNIYTYAMDSYIFGYLIFMLYTGMEINALQAKQKRLTNQRKLTDKNALQNKIEESLYMGHSFVHLQAKQNIKQIIKKISQTLNLQLQCQLQTQLIIFTLVYKCTLYNWYERPQMHQIISALKELKQNVLIYVNENDIIDSASFFRPFNKQQIIMKCFSEKNPRLLLQIINQPKVKQSWTYEGIAQLKDHISDISLSIQLSKQNKQLLFLFYEYFNKSVRQYLQHQKRKSGLFVQQENEGEPLLFNKSQSNIFDSNKKTPKDFLQLQSASASQKNWTKFGQTQKSMFIESGNKEWIQNQNTRKFQLSPKKSMTFLQSQSMMIVHKQASSVAHPKDNQSTILSPQHQQLTVKISHLLQLVISHISSIQSKSQLRIALYLMKDLLNDTAIKYYLSECDEKWVVPMYDVEGKKAKVNLQDKLLKLPKASVFYSDFYQLMEEKIVLNLINQTAGFIQQSSISKQQTVLHQSSKLLALNHIISILLSNNLNKLNALYQSNIISKLYIYLSSQDIEMKQKTLCIFMLLTKSLSYNLINTSLIPKSQRKGIDEIYRLMMVVYDELTNGLGRKVAFDAIEGKGLSQSPRKKSSISSSFRISTTTGSPQKKQSKESILPSTSNPTISLLTYTQNMYTIKGQQCQPLLHKICKQQVCHLYSLIILSQQIYVNRSDYRYIEILQNLLFSKQLFSKLNSHLIGLLTPQRLKAFKKAVDSERFARIQRLLMSFQESCTLLQLSTQLHSIVNNKPITKILFSSDQGDNLLNSVSQVGLLIECINRNIQYFQNVVLRSSANCQEQNQSIEQSNQLSLGEYNAFFVHFGKLLRLLSDILAISMKDQKNNKHGDGNNITVKTQQNKLNLLERSLTYLQLTIQHWQTNPILITNLIQLLQHFYTNQHSLSNLYSNNILQQQCITRLLKITQHLSIRQTPLMMSVGFLHLYSDIIKKQYQRMMVCFDKRVEKNKIVPIYFVQAQWRLTVLQAFIGAKNSNNNRVSILSYEQQKEVSKQLSNLSFTQFVCNQLFTNLTLMDLRFYQSFEEGVPFRFCRPFRCQAIVIIGILLKSGNDVIGGVQSEVASQVVPLVQPMTEKLKHYFSNSFNQQQIISQKQLLEVLEIIWLFSQLSRSIDQRLKYQFINSGTHEVLQIIFTKHKKIRLMFPILAETIKSNKILTSSKIFQKSMLYESKRQSKRITDQFA